jgi:hypothetical protein
LFDTLFKVSSVKRECTQPHNVLYQKLTHTIGELNRWHEFDNTLFCKTGMGSWLSVEVEHWLVAVYADLPQQ